MTLPADPSCYTNLETLVVRRSKFFLDDSMARALVQSKKLNVLVLEVSSFDTTAITTILELSESLSVFYILTDICSTFTGRRYKLRARLFGSSQRKKMREEGKLIDFEIFDTWQMTHVDQELVKLNFYSEPRSVDNNYNCAIPHADGPI